MLKHANGPLPWKIYKHVFSPRGISGSSSRRGRSGTSRPARPTATTTASSASVRGAAAAKATTAATALATALATPRRAGFAAGRSGGARSGGRTGSCSTSGRVLGRLRLHAVQFNFAVSLFVALQDPNLYLDFRVGREWLARNCAGKEVTHPLCGVVINPAGKLIIIHSYPKPNQPGKTLSLTLTLILTLILRL